MRNPNFKGESHPMKSVRAKVQDEPVAHEKHHTVLPHTISLKIKEISSLQSLEKNEPVAQPGQSTALI